MIAGRVLGDDLALEAREGIGEHRRTGGTGPPVQAGESVRIRVGRSRGEALVLSTQHVDGESPGAAHARPRVRAPRRTDRDQRRLERDRAERIDDEAERLSRWSRRDKGDAGGELRERFAE